MTGAFHGNGFGVFLFLFFIVKIAAHPSLMMILSLIYKAFLQKKALMRGGLTVKRNYCRMGLFALLAAASTLEKKAILWMFGLIVVVRIKAY